MISAEIEENKEILEKDSIFKFLAKASKPVKREPVEPKQNAPESDVLEYHARLRQQPGQVIVINDKDLTDQPLLESLGCITYHGAHYDVPCSKRPSDLRLFLLPPFEEKDLYHSLDIIIPPYFLSWKNNLAISNSTCWGTDIYTDDSDIVAALIHMGMYKPVDAPASYQIPGQNDETIVFAGTTSTAFFKDPYPKPIIATLDERTQLADHALVVTIQVLPRLKSYCGSRRYGVSSRGWGAHHRGESFMINSVRMKKL